jgi:predicted acetyltransferase
MDIQLIKVSIQDKIVLENLLELYKYDFSEFDNEDVNDRGQYGYRYIDNYWTEPDDRFPYLIKVDGNYAGFALIRKIIKERASSEFYYSVAEFFIMKKYRHNGLGKQVAFNLFDLFPGDWEVTQIEENIPAQKFWRKIISEYTNDNYKEYRNANLDGPTQSFSSKRT